MNWILMDKNSHTFRAFKNISYNILGFLWPIFFTLLITPIIIFKLGVKEYGVYLFVTTALYFLGLIDLGIGTALSKYMSYYYGKNDPRDLKALAHSANSLFLIIGLAGFSFVTLSVLGGSHLLGSRFADYEQYSILFFIGGCMYFLRALTVTSNAMLVAVQRFDILTKIGMAQITFNSLTILGIVEFGGSLTAIFIGQLILTALLTITFLYCGRKVMPTIKYGLAWDKAKIKDCYKFGLVNSVINLASSALSSLDKLVIPFYAGASNLTYYSIGGSVGGKIPGMSASLSATLLPTVSQLSGSEDMSRIRILYIRSFRLITIIAAALTITAISFSYKILLFWMDANFAAQASTVLIILAVTNFFLALFGPLSNFLFGLGKLKFLCISSIGMAALNAIALLILLPKYGILGASYAYLISVLPVVYLFYYVETKFLQLSDRKKHYIKTILGTVLTSALVWVINIFLGQFIVSLLTLLAVGGLSVLIYIIIYKLCGFFENEDWRDFEKFYQITLRRMRLTRYEEATITGETEPL
jgi:O-antigen/teichoic acid export membrane protein